MIPEDKKEWMDFIRGVVEDDELEDDYDDEFNLFEFLFGTKQDNS